MCIRDRSSDDDYKINFGHLEYISPTPPVQIQDPLSNENQYEEGGTVTNALIPLQLTYSYDKIHPTNRISIALFMFICRVQIQDPLSHGNQCDEEDGSVKYASIPLDLK